MDKSYLPQYITPYLQPSPDYTKLGNECKAILIYPDSEKPQTQLNPENGNCGNGLPNANTPLLLAQKKKSVSHIPTKTNFFGIFLAFVSGVFFTLCSSLVKFLTGVDPMELLIFRSLFQVGNIFTPIKKFT